MLAIGFVEPGYCKSAVMPFAVLVDAQPRRPAPAPAADRPARRPAATHSERRFGQPLDPNTLHSRRR